jgi:hypothetical protein
VSADGGCVARCVCCRPHEAAALASVRGCFDQPAAAQPRSLWRGGERRVLATVADPASARRLAADLVDPGQADRVSSDARAFRARGMAELACGGLLLANGKQVQAPAGDRLGGQPKRRGSNGNPASASRSPVWAVWTHSTTIPRAKRRPVAVGAGGCSALQFRPMIPATRELAVCTGRSSSVRLAEHNGSPVRRMR